MCDEISAFRLSNVHKPSILRRNAWLCAHLQRGSFDPLAGMAPQRRTLCPNMVVGVTIACFCGLIPGDSHGLGLTGMDEIVKQKGLHEFWGDSQLASHNAAYLEDLYEFHGEYPFRK